MRIVLDRHVALLKARDDIVVVREYVRRLAQESDFGAFATLDVVTASTELARNALVHGCGGHAHLERIAERSRRGIRAEFLDRGPGIADLARALAGGHGSRGSLGLGLSGSRRLVDEFNVDARVGGGTIVSIVKWRSGL